MKSLALEAQMRASRRQSPEKRVPGHCRTSCARRSIDYRVRGADAQRQRRAVSVEHKEYLGYISPVPAPPSAINDVLDLRRSKPANWTSDPSRSISRRSSVSCVTFAGLGPSSACA